MKLRLYLSSAWHDSHSACPWALCDDAGTVLQSGNSPISSLPKADEYIAIIAAEQLTCVNVPMPAQGKHRWESALPFVAEKFTLTDPEENHVVPGGLQKDGRRSLFIVDKKWLQDIVHACYAHSIPLRRAVPEILLPELPPNTWVLVWHAQHHFMRTGNSSGMVLDRGDEQHPPLALTLCLKAAVPTPPENILFRCSAEAAESVPPLPQWNELGVPMTRGENWDWRQATIAHDSLNLLWGPLAAKTKLSEWLPKLRPLAYIFLAALLIETCGANIEWTLLNQQKNNVTKEMERTFRKTFGESSTVVNPALQMQRNIATLRHTVGASDESDFLPLLDQISSMLATLPTSSITALHYESGRLNLDVKLRDEAAIHQLQKRLLSQGSNVRVSDLRDTGNGFEARFIIQAGGAS